MTRIPPSRSTRARMRRQVTARTRRRAAVGNGEVNEGGGGSSMERTRRCVAVSGRQ